MTGSNAIDLRTLRRQFHDTLHRGPTPRETRTFLGTPVDRVAKHLVRRREALEQWIEEELFYFLLLDRFRPKEATLDRVKQRLAKARATARDGVTEILLSSGFSLRNPGNDTFVTVVLEQCLGIEVQDRKHKKTLEAGKEMYDGQQVSFLGTKGRSQSDLVRIVIAQEQFTEHLLDRHHQRLFDKPLYEKKKPDERAQAAIDRVHADPEQFFDLLGEWLSSDEYVASAKKPKPRTDRQFVRSIFTDLLGRQPDYQELRNVRNALQSMADSTPLRAVIAKVLLDSRDAQLPRVKEGEEEAFIAECFLRYLGRDVEQGEQSKFASALRDGSANGKLVIRTLVTSPEYQMC